MSNRTVQELREQIDIINRQIEVLEDAKEHAYKRIDELEERKA